MEDHSTSTKMARAIASDATIRRNMSSSSLSSSSSSWSMISSWPLHEPLPPKDKIINYVASGSGSGSGSSEGLGQEKMKMEAICQQEENGNDIAEDDAKATEERNRKNVCHRNYQDAKYITVGNYKNYGQEEKEGEMVVVGHPCTCTQKSDVDESDSSYNYTSTNDNNDAEAGQDRKIPAITIVPTVSEINDDGIDLQIHLDDDDNDNDSIQSYNNTLATASTNDDFLNTLSMSKCSQQLQQYDDEDNHTGTCAITFPNSLEGVDNTHSPSKSNVKDTTCTIATTPPTLQTFYNKKNISIQIFSLQIR